MKEIVKFVKSYIMNTPKYYDSIDVTTTINETIPYYTGYETVGETYDIVSLISNKKRFLYNYIEASFTVRENSVDIHFYRKDYTLLSIVNNIIDEINHKLYVNVDKYIDKTIIGLQTFTLPLTFIDEFCDNDKMKQSVIHHITAHPTYVNISKTKNDKKELQKMNINCNCISVDTDFTIECSIYFDDDNNVVKPYITEFYNNITEQILPLYKQHLKWYYNMKNSPDLCQLEGCKLYVTPKYTDVATEKQLKRWGNKRCINIGNRELLYTLNDTIVTINIQKFKSHQDLQDFILKEIID